jgi:hypothetical protein
VPRLRRLLVHLTPRVATRAGLAALGAASLVLYVLDLHALFGAELRVLGIYVGVFGAAFVLYLAAAALVLRRPAEDPVLLGLILGFGLLFRVAELPAPVVLSSDVFRYVWDGRVQRAGVNPYRHPPSAPELASLRDAAIHPHINRPDKRTVYPPGAEMVFVAAARLGLDSVRGWRLIVFGGEVATLALLLAQLARLAMPSVAIILYAWAPLAVFEGMQAGHLDALLLPPLLLALRWRQDGRLARAGAALGAAVALKLYPAVLLLAWWRRGDWGFPTACLAVVALAYAPYTAGVGAGVLGFLPEYFGRAEDFNVGLRFFLTEALGLDGEPKRAFAMLALGAALLGVLLRIRRRLVEDFAGIVAAGRAAAGAYLALVPTAMHPWYVLWIVPFVTLAPSAAWLWFSGAVALSYLAYVWLPAPFPLWLRAVEWLPLYALLGWEARRGRHG